MTIESLHTYLVYPNKNAAEPKLIGGATVPLAGEVFDLLSDIYGKAERECSIDIAFNPIAANAAENPCRSLLLEYARAPSVEAGLMLATRLAAHSTKRSALGLLFIATGLVGAQRKIVIARFAANSGILADEDRAELSVQFVERVFLRSISSYKAVLYQDDVTDQTFWSGKAVDRQINSGEVEVSRYWISDFLDSDFKITSAQGTKVLAVAMRKASSQTENMQVKREITAAATLGANLNQQVTTAREFLTRIGLSAQAQAEVAGQVKHERLLDEQFRFSAEEFERQLPYKTVKLDTGAMLTAAAAEFDNVFEHGEAADDGSVTFTATGKVVNQRLEKSLR